MQRVPALVPLVDHHFELAGSVGAVLPGQAAVLIIHQLQMCEPLMNLPLETLQKTSGRGMNQDVEDNKGYNGFPANRRAKSDPSVDLTTDLELLELLLGDRVKDVCGVGVGSGALGHLQPILKPRVVIEEFTPESPRLLDPTRTHRAVVSHSTTR